MNTDSENNIKRKKKDYSRFLLFFFPFFFERNPNTVLSINTSFPSDTTGVTAPPDPKTTITIPGNTSFAEAPWRILSLIYILQIHKSFSIYLFLRAKQAIHVSVNVNKCIRSMFFSTASFNFKAML